jgi:acyl dehydratase
MSKRVLTHLNDLQPLIGQELFVSEWHLIDQARITGFADVTEDHQWLHVDEARAAKGPFGSTIAHGFLTLSLLSTFLLDSFEISEAQHVINYGINKLRYPAPVLVNSRVRGHFKLNAFEPLPGGGAQVLMGISVEREGSDKPVAVVEWVLRYYA